jgi:hypothetical protein
VLTAVFCTASFFNVTPNINKDKMYQQLVEYKVSHNGSLDMPAPKEEEKDNPGMRQLERLRRWRDTQLYRHRRQSQGRHAAGGLTPEKIEKLQGLGLRLTSYEQMYDKLAAHKADAGTLDVDRDGEEELFEWTAEQQRMFDQYSKGKPVALSDFRVQNLISLGFQPSGQTTVKKWSESLPDF